MTGIGAKGSVTYSPTEVREYRDTIPIDERVTYLAWLMQLNRGVFKSPWSKMETWTLSIVHSTRTRGATSPTSRSSPPPSRAEKLRPMGERWLEVELDDGRILEAVLQGPRTAPC